MGLVLIGPQNNCAPEWLRWLEHPDVHMAVWLVLLLEPARAEWGLDFAVLRI